MKRYGIRLAAALLAGAALTAAPAMAQKKDEKAQASKPVKLSKPVQTALAEAQKLQGAGDHAGALAKVAEAEAFPSPTPDDVYMTNALRLNSALATKDNALIEKSLTAMIASGRVSDADKPKFLRTIGSLALDRKDYQGATKAFEELIAIDPGNSENIIALAELYNSQKQSAKAVETINRAIEAKKASGQPVDQSWYRRALGIAYDGKLTALVQPAALALVRAYPNPVNWRDAVVITRDAFPSLDDQTELDFLRLQAATGALNGERDFVEYADTALGKGYPGEAQFAVNEGIAKKMLDPAKPLVKELKSTADSKVGADKAALPGLEREIKGNGKLAVATGDAYYGYGDFAKAATLYRQGVGNNLADQDTANLRLGMALARAGDKAGAAAALNAVKAGPRAALAKYWLAFIGA